MSSLEDLRQSLPEPAKDLKLNLQTVLRGESLGAEQALGCALASALFIREADVAAALLEEMQGKGVDAALIDDAKAAASIMAMNTTYYRTQHLLEDDVFTKSPAKLRMNRMMSPASSKLNFELFSMSCAALSGCQMCLKSHQQSLKQHDATDDNVHDSVRIAAVINGVATGLLAT